MKDVAGLFAWLIASLVFLGIIIFVVSIPFVGFHYETGRGEHTGYITSVEKSGIWFKTNSAYLKTDTQSSQEDIYCVIDPEIYTQLQEVAKNKSWVNVYYFSWLSTGISNCGISGDIIYKVEVINK
jgi:hypothetical protein